MNHNRFVVGLALSIPNSPSPSQSEWDLLPTPSGLILSGGAFLIFYFHSEYWNPAFPFRVVREEGWARVVIKVHPDVVGKNWLALCWSIVNKIFHQTSRSIGQTSTSTQIGSQINQEIHRQIMYVSHVLKSFRSQSSGTIGVFLTSILATLLARSSSYLLFSVLTSLLMQKRWITKMKLPIVGYCQCQVN